MRITAYKCLKTSTLDELTEFINLAIDEGWQPMGPLIDNEKYWIKEMIKTEEEPMTQDTPTGRRIRVE